MLAQAIRIASTPELYIMSMERRQELASMPVTLNGKPAKLVGVDSPVAVITDPQTGLCQPWGWDGHLERMMENGGHARTLSGWRTTSYFA